MKCALCGKKMKIRSPFCPSCSSRLLRSPISACEKCHSALSGRRRLCEQCRGRKNYFDRFYNLGYYAKGMGEIIRKVKFREERKLALGLGRMMGKILKRENREYNYIIPIPMSPKRFHERGFNQAYEIAKGVAKTMGVKLRADLLEKRDTIAFEQLNRVQRRREVKKAFKSTKKIGKAKGASILLVDDVFTTGTTVNAVAHLLKTGGALRVDAGVIAR